MIEGPYVHITPSLVGFTIRFGDRGGPSSPSGRIPLLLGTAWRPTGAMAEARGRRWLHRVERRNQREERTWTIDASE